ncbi:type II toxin-antitoxin system VapC family toxin [Microbacterium sp. LWH11-1.2]|uniref:type II toxin-antitoxin system VapC family toxin n=1 Tax=unclassified Microbacterium TaxID=2609290 RepID=UPI0031390639
MIVLDASALVEAITDLGDRGQQVREVMMGDGDWAMPAHGPTEVANALRGLRLARLTTDAEFRGQLALLQRMELVLFPVSPLLGRVADLAMNATAYDAAYLALGELLEARVLTIDRKLATVPGAHADVHVVPVG